MVDPIFDPKADKTRTVRYGGGKPAPKPDTQDDHAAKTVNPKPEDADPKSPDSDEDKSSSDDDEEESESDAIKNLDEAARQAVLNQHGNIEGTEQYAELFQDARKQIQDAAVQNKDM